MSFQTSAFQNSGFQTDEVAVSQLGGLGLAGRKKKYGEGVTQSQWDELQDIREQLVAMRPVAKPPQPTIKALRRLVEVVEPPFDVWTPPNRGQSVASVLSGLEALIRWIERDDEAERVRLMREDDEDAAILLLQ